ncbi:flagellar hook assembly protein FlgD [Shewanella sp. C32]|uniref:Basal-body rod modification protein FlgD n=1 Tax=Shewanella electrica TaxID=515560 RepID=A0ABT2FJE2_9GAMM|nr:flagellar hook assembly protein FlgD [Shewanella electrica]MCH1924551.1 flagellar hook assembly protein FlgD [Shewanella electrica]MCS4556452.1 flagellar hook assembly protein FlgD [Shewanella electrica]
MNSVNTTNETASASKAASSAKNNQSLTQEDFFSLLSAQLSMQDPSNPVDNDQMIAQMASFSTVDGIGKLNDQIVNLNTVMTSSQALQASGLVGQKVLVPAGAGYLSAEDNAIKGVISTPSPVPSIKVSVTDEAGQVVKTFTVDGSAGGNVDMSWDGTDNSGKPMASGIYNISANATIDGEAQDLAVSTYGHVSSVSLNSSSGAVLNVRGIGGVRLADVLAVTEA